MTSPTMCLTNIFVPIFAHLPKATDARCHGFKLFSQFQNILFFKPEFVFFCIWSKFRVNSATVVELLYPVLEMFFIALLTSFDVGIIQTIVSLLASPPPARVRYGASYGVGLWLWLWPAQRDPHAIQYFAQCLSLALELLTSFKTAISHFRSKLTV